MPRLARAVLLAERWTTAAAMTAAMACLAAAACAAFWQVIARFLLATPSVWSEPLTQVLVIWMAYLGLAGALRVGALVTVDLLRSALGGAWRRGLDVVVAGAVLVFLGLVGWWGYELAWRVRFQTLAGLGVPISWGYAAIPVGAAFAALAVVAQLLDPRHEEVYE